MLVPVTSFSRISSARRCLSLLHMTPALRSEQDCVMNFSRFINEVGVPWDAIHHQVWVSRWLFEKPHPAATVGRHASI